MYTNQLSSEVDSVNWRMNTEKHWVIINNLFEELFWKVAKARNDVIDLEEVIEKKLHVNLNLHEKDVHEIILSNTVRD